HAADAKALALAKAPLDLTLAQRTRQYTITLAQGLTYEDLNYAGNVAYATYTSDINTALSQKTHGYNVKAAELVQAGSEDDVSSANREAIAGARGDYEYNLYNDYA